MRDPLPVNAGRRYFAAADVLRILCIFTVAWFHIWQQSWLDPSFRIAGHYFDLQRIVRRGYMLVDLTLMLTGCVQYKWVKPGVSDAEMNKKLTECEAQALIDLPPDNVVTGSDSEKTDLKNKKKDISTSYTVEDANEDRRATLVDSCMFKSGWDKIEVQ